MCHNLCCIQLLDSDFVSLDKKHLLQKACLASVLTMRVVPPAAQRVYF